jgi:hypothetical protein
VDVLVEEILLNVLLGDVSQWLTDVRDESASHPLVDEQRIRS